MIWCTDDFDVWWISDEDVDEFDEIREQIHWEKRSKKDLTDMQLSAKL